MFQRDSGVGQEKPLWASGFQNPWSLFTAPHFSVKYLKARVETTKINRKVWKQESVSRIWKQKQKHRYQECHGGQSTFWKRHGVSSSQMAMNSCRKLRRAGEKLGRFAFRVSVDETEAESTDQQRWGSCPEHLSDSPSSSSWSNIRVPVFYKLGGSELCWWYVRRKRAEQGGALWTRSVPLPCQTSRRWMGRAELSTHCLQSCGLLQVPRDA